VSDKKHLKRISDKGIVKYFDAYRSHTQDEYDLKNTGRRAATIFPGFCGHHDQLFQEIDNDDFIPGNNKQEFLFAMRAAAREYTVRQAVQYTIDNILKNNPESLLAPQIKGQGRELISNYNIGYKAGTNELEKIRTYFNHNLSERNYRSMCSITLVLNKEYPLVASSTFKLEEDPVGKIVNDFDNLKSKPKPLFLNIFPQNNKTFCVISWRRVDKKAYASMQLLAKYSKDRLKILISNILVTYVENFAVNPTYWDRLNQKTHEVFRVNFGKSTLSEETAPLIFDPNFSLFV
jgi:hypothetical protein